MKALNYPVKYREDEINLISLMVWKIEEFHVTIFLCTVFVFLYFVLFDPEWTKPEWSRESIEPPCEGSEQEKINKTISDCKDKDEIKSKDDPWTNETIIWSGSHVK